MKWAWLVFVATVLLLSGCGSGGQYTKESLDSFAQCLTANDVVMYGAFWCPHCANTKKKFGSSFQYVTYVECDPRGDDEQSELCLEREIENYDTWEFADGSRVVGEPKFETLSGMSGCAMPEVK
jgi:hypothetical protein